MRESESVCVYIDYISDSFSCLAEDVVVKCNGLVVGLKLVNLTDLFCIFVEPIEMQPTMNTRTSACELVRLRKARASINE